MRISAEKVRKLREAKGWSQTELARQMNVTPSVKPQTIQAIEAGKVRNPRNIVELADALGVTPNDLLVKEANDSDNKDLATIPKPLRQKPHNPLTDTVTVPIFGKAVGGVDGHFAFNGQDIGRAAAPPNLKNVPGSYAVYVSGESMEPRYYSGELVFVNPNRPPTRNSFVVVQIRPGAEGEPPLGFIKQFMRQNGKHLVLRQFNPDKEIQVPVEDVVSVHRIVGSSDDP